MYSLAPALFRVRIETLPSSPSLPLRFFPLFPAYILKYELLSAVPVAKLRIIYTNLHRVPVSECRYFLQSVPHAEGVLFTISSTYPFLNPYALSAPCPARWGSSIPEWADTYLLWSLRPCIENRKQLIRALLALRNFVASYFYLHGDRRANFLDIGYVRLHSDGRFEFLSDFRLSEASLFRELSAGAALSVEQARNFLAMFTEVLRFLYDLGVVRVYAVAIQFDFSSFRYTV